MSELEAQELITLRGVSKQFGPVQALRGVDAVVKGRIIGLLGPNGAGKSTLLKCLLGLLTHQGKATVLGMSSETDGPAIRDRVGYMPESETFLAGMSGVEFCAYAAELSGRRIAAAVGNETVCRLVEGDREDRRQDPGRNRVGRRHPLLVHRKCLSLNAFKRAPSRRRGATLGCPALPFKVAVT